MDMPTTATEPKRRSRRRARSARVFGAAVAIALGAVCLGGAAFADGTPSPTPTAAQEQEADALFQRANELVKNKDFAAACPLFEQSYHIAGGGGTAQNLAICYEDLGKIAQAYRAFSELRRVSLTPPRPDRIKLADEHMARLEPRLSRIRVRVPEARRSPDLLVSIDGDTYGDKALEAGVVVDVGPHVVKLVAPGRKTLELTRTVAQEGTTETVDVPVTDAEPAPSAAAPSKDDRESARTTTRTAGLVLGGAGLVTLFTGGIFAILTATTNGAARRACRDQSEGMVLSNKGPTDDPTKMFDASGGCYASTAERPNPYLEESNRIRDEARGYGTIATIMVPVGIAGVVAGTYMVLVSRPESGPPRKTARAPAAPSLVPSLGGVMLVGELP